MAFTVPTSSHLLFFSTTTRSLRRAPLSALSPPSGGFLNQKATTTRSFHLPGNKQRIIRVSAVVGTAETAAEATKKKSSYEIQTLTGWLLKQEQAGNIDAELTIVLSSISMACKQIASLVQRAGISNLTGIQGAVNVQGEDQKKLDVVSNEVSLS